MKRSAPLARSSRAAFTTILVVMSSGCAAIGTRIIHREPFAGVKTDYAMCFHRDGIDPQCRINPALAVIDAPFSLVADLLFLPWDIGHTSGHSLHHPPAIEPETEDEGIPNQTMEGTK